MMWKNDIIMAQISSITRIRHHLNLIPGGSVERCTIQSDILGAEKTFTVYLPLGYDDNESQRYPVLYLFHSAGATDQTWTQTGQLKEIADNAVRSHATTPMIIVMPDASGSDERHLGKRLGYFSVEGWDYESYFHRELIPAVDSTYRTIAEKNRRAVAGVSMGGEAAVAYAQKNPGFYGASCAISGILGKPEQSVMAKTDPDYADGLVKNNPAAFVERATPSQVEALQSVRWYADCGDNDFFYEGNIQFFLAMKAKKIPIEYRMRSGVHDWYYWTSGLPAVLQFVSGVFTI